MLSSNFSKSFIHVITGVIASTLIVIGVQWDISWHESIGRDTFWTPAHIVIYIGGILGGLGSGFIVIKTTFGKDNSAAKASSVSFWGFKGPIGAWVSIWGAIAMLTSAPFDDWWHNAYGLDVEIISPPHTLLAMGFFAIIIGTMLIILSKQNLANHKHNIYSKLYPYCGSLLLLFMMIFTMEKSFSNKMHSLEFYKVMAIGFPFLLVAIHRSSKFPWPATTAAAICILHRLIVMWVLPLFDAQPLLGPIYRPVDYMVAPPFPVLIILPSIGIDWILMKWKKNDWILSFLIGIIFIIILFPFQWYFAEFLLSENAQNHFFGESYNKPYWAPLGEFNYKFWEYDFTPSGHKIPLTAVTPLGFILVAFYGMFSARIGLWWGNWLKHVKR